MPAAERRKGHNFERAVCRWLNDNPFVWTEEHYDLADWGTTRNVRPGLHDDIGDLVDPLGVYAIECKDVARLSVQATFTLIERKAGDDYIPVLVWKRRQRPIDDALVVVRLKDWKR